MNVSSGSSMAELTSRLHLQLLVVKGDEDRRQEGQMEGKKKAFTEH